MTAALAHNRHEEIAWRGGLAKPTTRLVAEETAVALSYNGSTQAVMMATNDTYVIFALLAIMGAAIIWVAPKPHRRGKK